MKLSNLIRLGVLPALGAWLGCNTIIGLELGEPEETGSGGATPSSSSGDAPASGAGGQPAGSGGAGGQPAGSGGAGGGVGGADAGCRGSEEVCAPWWDPTWARRRRILVDLANTTPLIDFPVLVRLDSGRIDYASAQPDGGDVRFLSEDGATILSHEVEAWAQDSSSYVWVRLPTVLPAMTDGPTVIWMYYGNPGAASPAAPQATWDPGFRSVHHFHADVSDSTAAANDAASPTPPSAGPGPVAGARVFDGVNDLLILPDEGDYDFTTMLSVSAWIRVSSFTKNWQAIVVKGNESWRLHRHDNTNSHGLGTTNVNNQNDSFGAGTNVNDGSWHHIAGVYDGQTKRLFVDGELVETKSFIAVIQSSSYPVCIGENNQETGRHFHGSIDEVRISSVARSDAWLAAEHRTVTNDDALTFGIDQLVP